MYVVCAYALFCNTNKKQKRINSEIISAACFLPLPFFFSILTCVCCVNFQNKGICVVYPCKDVCFLCQFEVLFLLHMPFIKQGHM
jgi:hypothetical protein